MIGYLQGKILIKKHGEVWLNANGVGYRVRVGERLEEKLIEGKETELYIHTAVREDAITLYGFASMQELTMYELMLSVSGVGPKTALSIVGSQTVERIHQAAADADVSFFQHIPGIGKKGAQRIIVDLKGKIPSLKELDLTDTGNEEDEVVSALTQFGFQRKDVLAVLSKLEPGLSEEQKIREGLKRLGKR